MQDQLKTQKFRFHSLDALRFFAFLQIYFIHLPISLQNKWFAFYSLTGGIAIAFFFVLSGFLITNLLIKEKLKSGTIKVKGFLIRRFMRIAPIFYLVLLFIFILPKTTISDLGLNIIENGYDLNAFVSFAFLDNYRMLFLDSFPKTAPVQVFWSLCVEVHFYLLWLVLFLLIPLKYLVRTFVVCIAISWLARVLYSILLSNQFIFEDLFTNLDYFAIGGILSYLVSLHFDKVTSIINGINLWIKRSFLMLLVIFIFIQGYIIPDRYNLIITAFKPTVVGVLYAFLIAIFIPIQSKIQIKSKVLNYLGEISYGLYVYHLVALSLVHQYFINHNLSLTSWKHLIGFIIITFSLTILISMLSYHYFEKPFLSLRERLTKSNS